MKTKELKIEIPQGYEIDKEKSTFEKIIFKKIPENPKTWEEYCALTKGSPSFYATLNAVDTDKYSGEYNEFATKKRAEQFIALGKLLQLRDYWVGGWKITSDNIYVIYKNVIMIMTTLHNNDFPLTFPTREMAKEFKNCYEDLIKEAYPLV